MEILKSLIKKSEYRHGVALALSDVAPTLDVARGFGRGAAMWFVDKEKTGGESDILYDFKTLQEEGFISPGFEYVEPDRIGGAVYIQPIVRVTIEGLEAMGDSARPSAEGIENSYADFKEVADELMNTGFTTLDADIERFLEFCETDETAKELTGDLRNNPRVDIESWLKEFADSNPSGIHGGHRYKLPSDRADRAAVIYQLLEVFRKGTTDLLNFASDAYGETDFPSCIHRFNEKMTRKLIAVIEERFEKLRPTDELASITVDTTLTPMSNKVFIVHGHDNLVKESVSRFVGKLGLEAIILHEQANSGKTIIEKLEHHADVSYAIVLYSPDDVGSSASQPKPKLQGRARQNVIFEHGYFLGRLGRDKVCALYKHGTELPSDLSGVLYIPLDERGAWQFDLAKELNAANMPVDLTRIFS